jgi:hypothetical protein
MTEASSEAGKEATAEAKENVRQSMIDSLKQKGYTLMSRSAWHAAPPVRSKLQEDWNYTDVVIHHAGHSYVCTFGADAAINQIKEVQKYDMGTQHFADVGYHFAITCGGWIIEARDVRYRGEHVARANTGKIGIVLLEDLAKAGEAWTFEYRNQSLTNMLRHLPGIVRDQTAFRHDVAPKVQTDALSVLIATLKEFFPIKALGGHREYQMLAPGSMGRACPGTFGMQVVMTMRAKFNLPPPSKEQR